MQTNLIRLCPIVAATLFAIVLTGCSPVTAENNQTDPQTATPISAQLSQPQTNQSPATNSEEENAVWVRLAKPTCH